MDTSQVLAAFATAFISLVSVLVWFIKRVFERDERNTDKFITTLENVVVRNAATMEAVGHAVTELTTLVREARVADREEHRSMIAAIGNLRKREFTSIPDIPDNS